MPARDSPARPAQDGLCFQQLYVSRDFGASWAPVVDFVQQYDWGPGDDTVVYSAFDSADGEGGHQFLRNPSSLNLYRRDPGRGE